MTVGQLYNPRTSTSAPVQLVASLFLPWFPLCFELLAQFKFAKFLVKKMCMFRQVREDVSSFAYLLAHLYFYNCRFFILQCVSTCTFVARFHLSVSVENPCSFQHSFNHEHHYFFKPIVSFKGNLFRSYGYT